MSGKQIISLQFGNYSNYVGTHIWNTQVFRRYQASLILKDTYFGRDEVCQELDYDVLSRSGRNLWGEETFTPRLLAFDLKENFVRMPVRSNALYAGAESSAGSTWKGEVDRVIEDISAANEFLTDLNEDQMSSEKHYQLSEKTVKSWSDFTKVYYHPNTMVEINSGKYQLDAPLDTFVMGKEIMNQQGSLFEASFENRFRRFAEECDSLDGLNVMVDVDDCFGGIAASFLEYVRDDLSKLPITCWTFTNTSTDLLTARQMQKQIMNRSLSMQSLAETASIYCPIDVSTLRQQTPNASWHKYLSCDFMHDYTSSAFIAASIETALLPVRTKKKNMPLGALTTFLNWRRDCNLVQLEGMLPVPIRSDDILSTIIDTLVDDYSLNLSLPKYIDDSTDLDQAVSGHSYHALQTSLRGFIEDSFVKEDTMCLNRMNSSLLSERLSSSRKCYQTQSLVLKTPFPLSAPFPHMLNSCIREDGTVDDTVDAKNSSPTSILVATTLANASSSSLIIRELTKVLQKVQMGTMWEFGASNQGIGQDDVRQLYDQLETIADCYLE